MLLQYVLVCLVVLPVITTKAQAADGMKPVLVYYATGDAPDALKGKVLRTVSASLEQATLSELARATYGRGDQFRWHKDQPEPGPLGAIGRSLIGVDRALDRDLSAALKDDLAALGERRMRIAVSAFLVNREHALPAMKDQILGANFGMLYQALRGFLVQPKATPTLLEGIDDLSVLDLTKDTVDLGRDDQASYKWLAENVRDYWAMHTMSLDVYVEKKGIFVRLDFGLKPAVAGFYQEQKQPGVVEINYIKYQPQTFDAQQPALVQVRLERNYATSASEKPTATISFGHMGTGGYSECYGDGCIDQVFRQPTLAGKIVPPASLGNGLKDVQDVFIILQSLQLDLGDPAGIKILNEGSKIPIVVRFNLPLNNKTQIIVHEKTKVAGFNIYSRFVGNKITSGLNDNLKTSAAKADAEAAKALIAASDQVAALLR